MSSTLMLVAMLLAVAAVRGLALPQNAALVYHKPCGLVTTHHDELGRRTVYDALAELLPPEHKTQKWHACGRLDQDTSGLLVMTTDGRLVKHVTDPTAGAKIEKQYHVKCHALPAGALDKLQSGVDLGNGLGYSSPAHVELLGQERKSDLLAIGICEGKNRQIRRMLHAVGSGVMALQRQRVGGLELGDLGEGEFRWLSATELKEALGYPPPAEPAIEDDDYCSSRSSSSSSSSDGGSARPIASAQPSSASYALLDCGGLRRLERFGSHVVSRPCPSATWPCGLPSAAWDAADLSYVEATQAGGTAEGKGFWEGRALASLQEEEEQQEEAKEAAGGTGGGATCWAMEAEGDARAPPFVLQLQPGPSGQLGAFPEQQVQWTWLQAACEAGRERLNRPLKVLNLFAHTGGSSLACAAGGAEVTHLDGARSAVGRARANAEASGLGDATVRWIADDVLTYVSRAAKRGERYDGVILDPPAFGRGGKKGEWRIQRDLPKLTKLLSEVLHDEPSFVLLTCHDARWPAERLEEAVADVLSSHVSSTSRARGVEAAETGRMVLRASEKGGRSLPMGEYARWCVPGRT